MQSRLKRHHHEKTLSRGSMVYDPKRHHRRSIRLKGYDYSKPGAYFVTVTVQNRLCLFGHIEKKEMILNDAGKMIKYWWNRLITKYKNFILDEYIIMPDHMHGIIILVGVDPRVYPDDGRKIKSNWFAGREESVDLFEKGTGGQMGGCGHMGPHQTGPPQTGPSRMDPPQTGPSRIGPPQTIYSLSDMIQWFKTMTTNEYIRHVKQDKWPPFYKRLWQRDYYEHIIRNDQALNRIRQYIINNPRKWKTRK